jgi:hypothetical protein
MSLNALLEWNALVGEIYGTEDKSLFLYSLVKMQKPENIVEIGTGLGVSSFWMAHALKENGSGHVWTVDNGTQWNEAVQFYELNTKNAIAYFERLKAEARLAPIFFENGKPLDYFSCMARAVKHLELDEVITILNGEVSLLDTKEVTPKTEPLLARAIERPIDLLFADTYHGPWACLSLLVKYLPLMADYASIFIDSAPTMFVSYLALEQVVAQLNAGKIPAFFYAGTSEAQRARLVSLVASRRFTFVPLVEKKDRDQNGLAGQHPSLPSQCDARTLRGSSARCSPRHHDRARAQDRSGGPYDQVTPLC